MNERILVVEDDPGIRPMIRELLEDEGYIVSDAGRVREAQLSFDEEPPELVLVDVGLPDGSGLELVEHFRAKDPSVVVIVMTANADVRVAVDSMKSGAYDFIEKPFRVERFRTTVRKALREVNRDRALERMVQGVTRREEFIGKSPAVVELLRAVDQIAREGGVATVLIQGETGTGKDLVAKRLHSGGPRPSSPYFAESCANLSSNLLEDQLFGHSRGAFSDAVSDQKGLMELAGDGTLFLDEIGEMSAELQAKLLRVIENREFLRLGDHRPIRVEARLVTATHRDLRAMVEEGGFRQDLYYRLNIVPIRIPPLRERREDIPALLEHFRTRFNAQYGRSIEGFESGVFETLLGYEWPGNVRQMQNWLEGLAITWAGGARVGLPHLQGLLWGGAPTPPAATPLENQEPGGAESGFELHEPRLLDEVVDEHIWRTYKSCDRNKKRTAEVLGITRQTVQKRLERMPSPR